MKRWLFPIGLTLLAGTIAGVAFAWAICTGVAIPNPDEILTMREYTRFHMRIVDRLLLAGLGVFALALLSAVRLAVKSALARTLK